MTEKPTAEARVESMVEPAVEQMMPSPRSTSSPHPHEVTNTVSTVVSESAATSVSTEQWQAIVGRLRQQFASGPMSGAFRIC